MGHGTQPHRHAHPRAQRVGSAPALERADEPPAPWRKTKKRESRERVDVPGSSSSGLGGPAQAFCGSRRCVSSEPPVLKELAVSARQASFCSRVQPATIASICERRPGKSTLSTSPSHW